MIEDISERELKDFGEKKKILFLCVENSARSQMAQGILGHYGGNRFEVFSAGVKPAPVNPYAIRVMNEIDIDISEHKSKSVNEFKDKKFDYVITVCDRAKENCPIFPGGGKYLHWSFDDPAEAKGSEEEILGKFRKVREEIKDNIAETFL